MREGEGGRKKWRCKPKQVKLSFAGYSKAAGLYLNCTGRVSEFIEGMKGGARADEQFFEASLGC